MESLSMVFDQYACPVRHKFAARNLVIMQGMVMNLLQNAPLKKLLISTRQEAAPDPLRNIKLPSRLHT